MPERLLLAPVVRLAASLFLALAMTPFFFSLCESSKLVSLPNSQT